MAEVITFSAAAGMQAAMTEIANRTNNLGNVNSLGYQSIETETKDSFYNHLSKAGIREAASVGEKPVNVYVGTGVKVTGTYRNLEQGTIKQTGHPLDMAIVGSGYFAVMLPNNVRGYSRAGAFQVNNARQVVTSEGYALEPAITIPENVQISTLKITEEGQITGFDGAGNPIEIGQIQVYGFANERGLSPAGRSYFTETEASGEGQANTPGDAGFGRIAQGSVELSNVKVANEFASFMAAQQAYDMSSRMLKAVDEMLKELNK